MVGLVAREGPSFEVPFEHAGPQLLVAVHRARLQLPLAVRKELVGPEVGHRDLGRLRLCFLGLLEHELGGQALHGLRLRPVADVVHLAQFFRDPLPVAVESDVYCP